MQDQHNNNNKKGTNPHLDLNTQVQSQLQKSPQAKENPAHLNLPGKGTIFRERLRIQERKTRGLPENKQRVSLSFTFTFFLFLFCRVAKVQAEIWMMRWLSREIEAKRQQLQLVCSLHIV